MAAAARNQTPTMISMFRSIALLLITTTVQAASYEPAWSIIQPKRIIQHSDPSGAALVKAVEALQPGDKLELAAGTYSVERMWDLQVSGTADAPIWIVAAKDAQVIITRPDGQQNVINVGHGKPVSFLCLRGLEVTGGSHGIRLGQCADLWLDQCHIHHTGEVCLSANSADTQRLVLTRNHIHHGAGHAEGMYLGANNGDHIMSESIIALNHIHDCRGDQGDGIEVKQGSWGNLIAENHVHDTNYPCITVYGTAGKPVNIIERNLCYNSADNVMQVQGEAIVRNNVLINGASAGFASTDHQGKTLNLQVIHNTIINTTHAFRGGSWNGREGMVLANNILYSSAANALLYPSGNAGVLSSGNIVFGDGPKDGCVKGRGLEDFPGVTLDGSRHDATPAKDAPIERADPKYLLPTDLNEKPRAQNVSGAIIR
jgi:Right handed beta helix region